MILPLSLATSALSPMGTNVYLAERPLYPAVHVELPM